MKRLISVIVILLFSIHGLYAKNLRIGLASDARSMDPMFHNETTTNSVLGNIFEGLVSFDKNLEVQPALALSWVKESTDTWIFTLQKGVTFHNGDPLSADDVVFSIERMKNWEKSGFKSLLSSIDKIEKIDDYMIKITTNGPSPVLLNKLTYAKILNKKYASAHDDEFLSLNPIGTGPYKLHSWNKGQSISLEANANYWKSQATYEKVELKILSNGATRVAAILSNTVDLIEKVPPMDIERIKSSPELQFFDYAGLRLIYLQMDQDRDQTPYVNGKNPFKDVKVRKAISLGIDRNAIVKYVMQGNAKVASQFSPEFVFGYDPSILPEIFNPEKAKKLLTEAGYPNGFEVTLDSPNDRYVNDSQIAQAIASSLSKIGIIVKVNAIPKSAFFPKTDKLDTSFFLLGWASNDGDASSFLTSITHSHDKKYGRYNRGRYSNPTVDKLIEDSGSEMDTNKRLHLLREAQKIALVKDVNAIPLHYEVDLYAARKNISFTPYPNTYINIYDIK